MSRIPTQFTDLVDHITTIDRLDADIALVRRNGRTLDEARTMLTNVARLLHEQRTRLKRELDARIEELNALAAKAKAAKKSKKGE